MFFLGLELLNIPPEPGRWQNTILALEVVEEVWKQPDEGIWEVRGPRRHFTHSKVMAWVAFDRAVRIVERFGAAGPVDRWRHPGRDPRPGLPRRLRPPAPHVHPVLRLAGARCERAADPRGRLSPADRRAGGRHRRSGSAVAHAGWLRRPLFDGDEAGSVDGLSGVEGAFLPCSFWLADALAGRSHRGGAPCSGVWSRSPTTSA